MTTPPPKRIDALNPTGSPTRAHEVPAMAGGLAVKLTVAQILSLIESGDLPAIQSAGIADQAIRPAGASLSDLTNLAPEFDVNRYRISQTVLRDETLSLWMNFTARA